MEPGRKAEWRLEPIVDCRGRSSLACAVGGEGQHARLRKVTLAGHFSSKC